MNGEEYKKAMEHFINCLSYEEQVLYLYNLLSVIVEQGGGIPGPQGEPGFSPTVEVRTIPDGHRIIITDEEGEHIFDVMDGENGRDGSDGFSPTVSVTDIAGGHRVVITDEQGAHSFDLLDGTDGSDGFSPTVSVTDITGGHRVIITDEQGAHSFDILDGSDGVSPTVSVTDITGGHRVVITDEQGTHSFDVADGRDGIDGRNGSDGFSPTVSVTDITGGHRVVITDENGNHSFDVTDGRNGIDGQNGNDGFSPTVSVTDITGGHRVVITDAQGAHSFDVEDGSDGSDGFSPTVSVTDITGGHRVVITDAQGAHSFDVEDGSDGSDGRNGSDGVDGSLVFVTTDDFETPNYTFDIVDLTGPTGKTPKIDDFILQNVNSRTYLFRINSVASTTVLSSYVCELTGATGPIGPTGPAGRDGSNGISPTITVTDHTTYTHIEIVSAGGTESFDIYNGTDGVQGPAGASFQYQWQGTSLGVKTSEEVSYNYVNLKGDTGATGPSGNDGVSPAVSVSQITGGHEVTITDATHPNGQTFSVMDGTDGAQGPAGPNNVVHLRYEISGNTPQWTFEGTTYTGTTPSATTVTVNNYSKAVQLTFTLPSDLSVALYAKLPTIMTTPVLGVDGRNSSKAYLMYHITNIGWSGSSLTFTITTTAGAQNESAAAAPLYMLDIFFYND